MIQKNRKFWLAALALVCLLVIVRLCLATLVRDAVNRQLAKMSGYSGRITGVGLSLWRGAYQIEGMQIEKKDGKVPVPFFSAPLIDIGLQWKALFKARIVAKVAMEAAQLNFVNGPSQQQGQSGKGEDWQEVLESLVPVKINRFSLKNSEIHFRDPYGNPPVDIHLEELDLLAEELSSRQEGRSNALGSISASARVMKDGRLALRARFDPFADAPTFDYGIELESLNLAELNPFLLRYLGVDVHQGSVDLYSEAAAADGKFQGYFKPMIKGLKVMKPNEKFEPVKLFKKFHLWILGWAFRDDKGQLATKIEFAGEYKDPKMSFLKAAFYLFKNAFIQSLPASLEGTVKVEDLQKRSAKVTESPR